MKTLRPPFFVFSAVFIALLLSACNLFQTSLTAYLTEEPGGKPPAGGGNEGGDDGPWVYVAADTGDDLKSGWSAGEAVKTISRALAVWSLEGAAEARIMLLEDITPANSEAKNANGLLVFSSISTPPPLPIEIPPSITAVTINGGGKALDNKGESRRVLFINYSGTTITLKNITITGGNAGTSDGGGIRLGAGALVLAGGVDISSNQAASGGGVYLAGTPELVLEGGTIHDNQANGGGRGGGVHVNYGTFTMKSGSIRENTAATAGGGVFVGNGTGPVFIMEGGTVTGNTAGASSTGTGGGVCVGASGKFTMEDGIIKENVSGNDGGGVYVSGTSGTAFIQGGSIGVSGGGNRAKYGAGIYVAQGGRMALGYAGRNDPFPYVEYNTSTGDPNSTGGGIAIFDSGGANAEVVFHHGTIRGNNGATLGGGILVVTGTLDMRGGTVTGNIADSGPGIVVESNSSTYVSSFIMSGYARVLDDGNPVYLDNANGSRKITLGAFTEAFPGELAGGIAKIALSSGYSSGIQVLIDGLPPGSVFLHHDKFTVIDPPLTFTINGSGNLQ